jgi:hypothetical protein
LNPTNENSGDEDLLQKAEKLVQGLLMFSSRICRTAIDFIFRPKEFQPHLLSVCKPSTEAKTDIRYAPPTIFLVVASVICTIYGYFAAKSTVGSKLLLSSPLFIPFRVGLDVVWKTSTEMKFEEVLFLMMPIIFVTAFFSMSNNWWGRMIGVRADFKTFFVVNSYTVGVYLLLHGLLFSYSMILAGFDRKVTQNSLSMMLLVVHLVIGGLIIVVMITYARLLQRILFISKAKTVMLLLGSLVMFLLLFVPILLFIFPIIPIHR